MTRKIPIQPNKEMVIEEAVGILRAIIQIQAGIHKLGCISDKSVKAKLQLEGVDYSSRIFQHLPKELTEKAAELLESMIQGQEKTNV